MPFAAPTAPASGKSAMCEPSTPKIATAISGRVKNSAPVAHRKSPSMKATMNIGVSRSKDG
ncbi:MAG: hypothetical protein SGJ17_11495 [Hyphomicrobiales bacterium]|nr:hypothetical protein [Hyphomicrobiales bacterium]